MTDLSGDRLVMHACDQIQTHTSNLHACIACTALHVSFLIGPCTNPSYDIPQSLWVCMPELHHLNAMTSLEIEEEEKGNGYIARTLCDGNQRAQHSQELNHIAFVAEDKQHNGSQRHAVEDHLFVLGRFEALPGFCP